MDVAPPPAARPGPSLGTEFDRVMRHPRLALVLLCLALWLPGFFTLPATDRDESRFAQATRQMLDSGDYVRIRVGAEERNKKPAGIHWLQAGAVHAVEALGAGDRTQIWPYRLPSLLGALLAVLATFEFGRALVGRRAALLGAAMLGSCMVLVAEAHIAKTDAALLASITAAMGLLGLAYLRPRAFTARQAAGFWLALGISVLLKGPIGPLVALLTGVTLAIVDRRAAVRGPLHTPWLRALRPAWGIPLMLAAAAPWFIAIGIATEGRFFAEAVGEDMLAKVGSGEERHWGPPGFYLATFGITAFPAAFLVLLALPGAWAARLHPPTRFLLAWIVPAWLLFEAVQTKLPHYTLPAYPALMLLGAAWALHPLRGVPPRWLRALAWVALAGVAAGLPLAALAAAIWLSPAALPGALLAVPAAAALGWVTLRAWRQRAWGRAGFAAVLLAVPLYAAVLEGVAPRLAPLWIAPRLAAALAQAAPGLDGAAFGITGHAEPSVQFAIGEGTALLRRGEDAARFLAAAPARHVVAVGDRAIADFRREAAAIGLAPREVGSVSGFNYTRGRWVTLTLFRGPA